MNSIGLGDNGHNLCYGSSELVNSLVGVKIIDVVRINSVVAGVPIS